MKIALLGYGKMGKTIAQLAVEKGHEILLRIDATNARDLSTENLKKVDVAIDFSHPESAFTNIKKCLEIGVPVVSGTTAWLDQLAEAKAICAAQKGAFFYASNFSVGVNIFFAINEKLAQLMKAYPNYHIAMEETHHIQKIDAPSGTAISLAKGILANIDHKTQWHKGDSSQIDSIPITSKRIDDVPGTHLVGYQSPIDSIEIKHTAHTREGFALGAILAAEWLIGKEGYFEMRDLLGI